jgi:hypothetical protein
MRSPSEQCAIVLPGILVDGFGGPQFRCANAGCPIVIIMVVIDGTSNTNTTGTTKSMFCIFTDSSQDRCYVFVLEGKSE